MYEIEGRIYEQHGEYKCYLQVWLVEGDTKQRVWNLWEDRLTPDDEFVSEHGAIIALVVTALRRNSQKTNVPLF